jgi:hypothetical protein
MVFRVFGFIIGELLLYAALVQEYFVKGWVSFVIILQIH